MKKLNASAATLKNRKINKPFACYKLTRTQTIQELMGELYASQYVGIAVCIQTYFTNEAVMMQKWLAQSMGLVIHEVAELVPTINLC